MVFAGERRQVVGAIHYAALDQLGVGKISVLILLLDLKVSDS